CAGRRAAHMSVAHSWALIPTVGVEDGGNYVANRRSDLSGSARGYPEWGGVILAKGGLMHLSAFGRSAHQLSRAALLIAALFLLPPTSGAQQSDSVRRELDLASGTGPR